MIVEATNAEEVYTVSFDVNEMLLDDRGAYGEDLAIRWDAGRAIDVLRLRVIPNMD